ncbi:MAG: HlyD family efflux transporter periplasmic adaptor subunit [Lachnospirales bacterium]
MKKKIIIVAIVIMVAIFLGFAIKNAASTSDSGANTGINGPSDGLLVKISEVKSENIIKTIVADGEVTMINKNAVYSPSTSKVNAVNFQVGDEVKVGDVLLTYDSKSIETLQDQLRLAKLDLEAGQLALESINIVSEEQVLQLDASLRASEEGINSAQKQLEQINLNIQAAQSQLEQSEKAANDGETLLTNGIISQNEYQDLKNALTSAQSNMETLNLQRENALSAVESAKKSYNDAEKQANLGKNKNSSKAVRNQNAAQQITIEKLNMQISDLKKQIGEYKESIISEYAGIILEKNVEKDMYVQSGSPLFTIGDTGNNNLIAKVNVLELDSENIKEGQKAIITGDSFEDKEIKGTVTKVHPTIESKAVNGTPKKVVVTEIKLDNSDTVIRDGSTIEAEISLSDGEELPVVPLMAIATNDDGEDYVLVVNEDFSVEKRIITIGDYTGSNVSVANLEVGETVVLEPSQMLKDGDFIKYTNITTEE